MPTTEIPTLDKGFVKLISHMGSDLSVVNAARVSFAKESEWESYCRDCESRILHDQCVPVLKEDDGKLIRYLAKHNHWTPFGHCQITLHFKMPIFVARQFMRSNIGIVYNEISRRYVDSDPEFYEPAEWRGRPPKSLKQGSSDEKITRLEPTKRADGSEVEDLWGDHDNNWHPVLHNSFYNQSCLDYYRWLIRSGIAPEQARICLPLSVYTEFWATMSLAAASRIVKLRIDPHAQWEIRQYAEAINNILESLYPVSWEALTTAQ